MNNLEYPELEAGDPLEKACYVPILECLREAKTHGSSVDSDGIINSVKRLKVTIDRPLVAVERLVEAKLVERRQNLSGFFAGMRYAITEKGLSFLRERAKP